jgi:hypothetical protein
MAASNLENVQGRLMRKYVVAVIVCLSLAACSGHRAFVLHDPLTDRPLANTPYRIVFYNRKILDVGPGITRLDHAAAEGTTDREGRTGDIRLDNPDDAQFDLIEKVGQGAYGQMFVLRWPFDDKPTRTWYEIRGCEGSPPYRGYTYKSGATIYYTDRAPCKIEVAIGDRYAPNTSTASQPQP